MDDIEGQRILLWGSGGGFDIYGGFFLYRHLVKNNIVYLANYSFTDDLYIYGDNVIVEITGSEVRTKKNHDYFPEHDLARFLGVSVYTARLFGPDKLIPALTELCSRLSIDLIIAIDAGHDALLFGDEGETRGSPLEDLISMVSISTLKCRKLLCCISVPTEDIPMKLFWKHLDTMKSAGGYIGAFDFSPRSQDRGEKSNLLTEAKAQSAGAKFCYDDPVDIRDFQTLLDSTSPLTRSIPNESLLASMQGRLGDHYQNPRLHQRMIADGCNELDYPNVTEETKYYWCFDISVLVEISPLIKSLVLHGQNCDSTEMNTLINQYYGGQSE